MQTFVEIQYIDVIIKSDQPYFISINDISKNNLIPFIPAIFKLMILTDYL